MTGLNALHLTTMATKPIQSIADPEGVGSPWYQKQTFLVSQMHVQKSVTAEVGVYTVEINNKTLRLILVYRPPGASTINSFTDYLCEVLEDNMSNPNLFMTGDFNIHYNDLADNDAFMFRQAMDSVGLQQHVEKPTHQSGNILDLFFSTQNSSIVAGMCEPTNPISDHIAVVTELSIKKLKHPTSTLQVRKIAPITSEQWTECFDTDNINLSNPLPTVCEDLSMLN